MQQRLPAEVPVNGDKYDLTLTGSGLDQRKREIAHFVIDNGHAKGVTVSAYLTPDIKQRLMALFGLTSDQVSGNNLDGFKYQLRVSATIGVERLAKNAHGTFFPVDEKYTLTNVYVNYLVDDLAEAENDSTLFKALQSKETKFSRKPKKSGRKSTQKDVPPSTATDSNQDSSENNQSDGDDGDD